MDSQITEYNNNQTEWEGLHLSGRLASMQSDSQQGNADLYHDNALLC